MLKEQPAQLPGLASRRERKKKALKDRVAQLEEFAGALLPLVLHLADQLEGATGRPLLRDVFPNRERFSAMGDRPKAPAAEAPK